VDALSLENVTKSYDSVTAVNAINLRVRQGAVLGLLGRATRSATCLKSVASTRG
jgi:ABC-type uncharacterized transport system ATPase subunit